MKPYTFFAVFFLFFSCIQNRDPIVSSRVVMDIPGHPLVFEINRGETFTLSKDQNSSDYSVIFKINDYKLYAENNLWFPDSLPQKNFYRADVFAEVNGKTDTLLRRAYQFPKVIEGFRWYVEAIAEWDTVSQVHPFFDLEKEIRISVGREDESWGPENLVYPIKEYRWHASSYMNTWSALVPYNHLYYHRGEDMAAIPDILEVVALCGGKIIASPYPEGDGRSNGLAVEGEDGFGFRLAHMNMETILPTSAEGLDVKSGQVLGKTGETWDGYKSQTTGPHLHVALVYANTRIGSYPYLMEAYFRDYPDKVLAVAGGYRFGLPGDKIELDASRSLVAQGEKIARVAWITHDGDTLMGEKQIVTFNKPGLYSKQLLVRTESGFIDRDFLQIRIYDPDSDGRDIVSRHVHYSPLRNIHPGDSVLFWNRLENNQTPVNIDFGDGSPSEVIMDETWHSFKSRGDYVVTFSTSGRNNEPATIQLEVKVE